MLQPDVIGEVGGLEFLAGVFGARDALVEAEDGTMAPAAGAPASNGTAAATAARTKAVQVSNNEDSAKPIDERPRSGKKK